MMCDIEINGSISRVNFSQKIGPFKPEHLIYFPQITEIDISGCSQITPDIFVDCIASCMHLIKFNLRGCTQFTEKMLQKMLTQLNFLKYVDCTFCEHVTFATAYNIVSALPHLLIINLEPRFPGPEINDWKRLIVTFNKVQFGVSIISMFHNYGMSFRTPATYASAEE